MASKATAVLINKSIRLDKNNHENHFQLSACWLIQQAWKNAGNITSQSVCNIYYFKNHTYMTEAINLQSISENGSKL